MKKKNIKLKDIVNQPLSSLYNFIDGDYNEMMYVGNHVEDVFISTFKDSKEETVIKEVIEDLHLRHVINLENIVNDQSLDENKYTTNITRNDLVNFITSNIKNFCKDKKDIKIKIVTNRQTANLLTSSKINKCTKSKFLKGVYLIESNEPYYNDNLVFIVCDCKVGDKIGTIRSPDLLLTKSENEVSISITFSMSFNECVINVVQLS